MPGTETSSPLVPTTRVVAVAGSSVSADDLDTLRSQVPKLFPERISPTLVKQLDPQSDLALITLHKALDQVRRREIDPSDWGVMASCDAPGREKFVDAYHRFRDQGPWAVRPNVIPFCSLHSLSGLICQALGCHGANLGIGGVPGQEGDLFLPAWCWLHGDGYPGLWVVWTWWTIDRAPICHALVLALSSTATSGRELHFEPSTTPHAERGFDISSFAEAVLSGTGTVWGIPGVGCLRLSPAADERRAAA